MQEKSFNLSIDKLCVLGKLQNESYFDMLLYYCQTNERFIPKYITTQFYTCSFILKDIGFLQFDRPTKNIRFEFNPNNVLSLEDKQYVNYILNLMYSIHFSRLDVALDLFNYDLYNYNIIDLNRRKSAYYYDESKKIETIYLGSMGSNKFIRIYNKAKEQKQKDKDWWRIELQLRDNHIINYLSGDKDFLDNVYIFKYKSLEKYNVNEKSMIEYLLFDISRINELQKNTKTKYKKIIKDLKMESLDFVNDLMQCYNLNVLNYLQYLCPNLKI